MVWVCQMCSTNNVGRARQCCVCDQKRPRQNFKTAFKLKFNSGKWITIEEKFHAKLVSTCREFFVSLITLMWIFLGVLVIIRASQGELNEVLNTLALLWENGKEKVTETVPDLAIYLWDRVSTTPFVQVKESFLYVMEGFGDNFAYIGDNFTALFPHISQNFVSFWGTIGLVVAEILNKIPVLFGNIGRIIARIVESITQFIKWIGA